jgi:16S rRNA (cytosine967-C5)-methyltransferase
VRAGAPLTEARDRHLEGLDERDRRLAYELSAGVLRDQNALDDELDLTRADPRLHDVLRLGVYQLRFLTRVPAHAAVSATVDLAREAVGETSTGYVNQALRKLAGAGSERGAGGSHPAWLVARWAQRFGEEQAQRLVTWNDGRPILTLQAARWDVNRVRAALEVSGVRVADAPFGAGLQVGRAPGSPLPAPRKLPGFEDGAWIVQDAAHALVCRFAGIAKGSLVYDAAAAPGGKAVALEAAGARVIAGDARRERIRRLVETARRAGVAIRCLAADLEAAPLRPDRLDAVLLDAPCSATGTMRRHPDARWRLEPGVFARAAARQRRLLAAAASLIRPGALLIYSTCSLEPEENSAVVEDFLSRNTEFARAATAPGFPAELLTADGDFQSLPQRHGIDGAYAARLVRRAAA